MALWAALWRSKNQLNSLAEHVIYDDCLPKLFRTKREATAWIREGYGYIRHRSDLRAEPHGWRIPKPVRVTIVRGE